MMISVLVATYAASRPSGDTSGCSTATMLLASTYLSGIRRVMYSSDGSGVCFGSTVSSVELLASLVATILITAPEGTVVNPLTCRTDWKTRYASSTEIFEGEMMVILPRT